MKVKDISAQFPGLFVIHQKIQAYTVEVHEHPEHEFFLPLQGEIQIEAANRTLKAGPGKMIYLPADTPHSFSADARSQGERVILMIDAKLWTTNDGGTFPPAVLSASQLCKEIAFQLLLHPKTKAAKSLAETLVQTLSEMLDGATIAASGAPQHLEGRSTDPRLRQALTMIEMKFAESLTTEELAKQSGLSVRNLNRLFLTEIGMTPKQVVTKFRIDRAKQLLQTGRQSVTDVSLEVGYNSVSQFISTFRKATGQLPSSFFPLNSSN